VTDHLDRYGRCGIGRVRGAANGTPASTWIDGFGAAALRAAAVVSLLAAASLAQGADGPYVAAGYAYTAYQTRCDGGACDRRDGGFRVATGWGFAKHWSVEAVYLDAGHFVASDVTAAGTPFRGRADLSAWGGTLSYEYPLGTAVTLGVRLGGASVKADFKPGPAPAIAGGKTTPQFLGGLSATWRFSHAWSARLDWDHTRGRMNRFNGDVDAASIGLQYSF
jgi:hypothetical protein